MRQVLNFNAGWVFSKAAEAVPATLPADWESVQLPHSWNAVDGQDGGNDYYRGTAYYAKTIVKAELPAADRWYLELQGANSSADVYLDGKALENWRIALSPLSEESVANAKASDGRDGFSGGHFRAVVRLDKTADTFIDMSKWEKGTVYVNGRNIGRYWNVGPQLSLYCPAPFLKNGENQIDIVELELAEPRPIRGLARPLYLETSVSTKNAANNW